MQIEMNIRDILVYKFIFARIHKEWETDTSMHNGIFIHYEVG